ncbi:restriction endonuclease subunit S [Aquabacterium sp.]|uniref:restriction endonuclease subunit S n=1 Tax=Aquabacterium sp. TaxID=1872578 RepID=UPI00261E7256|nr:restriction endonuclease subunit S [Aquabacterium sp.]MDD2976039.1 restriction endonuclease subunit S [Aquabacterium sp.]
MSFPRYPAYKDSRVEWLGSVPAHWRVERLKHVATVFPSNVDKKSYDDEAPVRLCNYTDVYYNDEIREDMDLMMATASAEQIEKFSLRAGDTIITKDSETSDDIAISAYVPKDLPGVVCGYHLSMVRPKSGGNGRFLKRFFDSQVAKAQAAVTANGLTRVGLGQYAIDNLHIAVPPLEEQVGIGSFLDRETAKIDALVAEQEQLITLLREKRQAVISHAVTKGLDSSVPMKDSGVEWLGEVPAHWQVKQLRHVARIVRGASPRPAGDPKFFSSDDSDTTNVPWVTVAEITKDDSLYLTDVSELLTPLGAEASQRFERGTVIFSNSGATLGVPKILAIDCCANDGVLAFKSLDQQVHREFLYFFLSTTTERLRTEMKQGGGQPNLNTDIVKNIGVAVPSLNEQIAIVSAVRQQTARFNDLICEAQRGVSFLQERRSALISAAVTGQIDVRGLAPEQEQAA